MASILDMSDRDAVELSPTLNVPAVVPPTWILYGKKETDAFERQSIEYAEALQAKGHQVVTEGLPDNHVCIMDEMANEAGVLAICAARIA